MLRIFTDPTPAMLEFLCLASILPYLSFRHARHVVMAGVCGIDLSVVMDSQYITDSGYKDLFLRVIAIRSHGINYMPVPFRK